jgi:hypothetical protein
MNLYKITEDIRLRLDALLDSDIELTEEEQACLFGRIKDEAKDKQLAVAAYIKNIEAEIKSMEKYQDEMQERVVKFSNKASKLKDYLKYSLDSLGLEKVEGIEFDISIKKNPPSVLIEDESVLPAFFIKEEVSVIKKIDKKLIAERLKQGEKVAGCDLVQNTRLEIK